MQAKTFLLNYASNSYPSRINILLNEATPSKDQSGNITSKQFAQICVEEVSAALNTKVRGVVKKEDIYIFQ